MTAAEHLERYGSTLQVHRIIPGSLYTVAGCVTLCVPCHADKPKRAPGQPDLGRPPGAMPRRTVQLPAAWLVVAQAAASERPMPVMWYLIELIRKDAEARGVSSLPTPPWLLTDPTE